nr:tail fiber assembly protein [Pectobacterium colocasium]
MILSVGQKPIMLKEMNGLMILTHKPTQEDLIFKAEVERLRLIENAKAVMSDWMIDLQLGIIDEDEKRSLADWWEYIKLLKTIDTSIAPDIDWPSAPDNILSAIKIRNM